VTKTSERRTVQNGEGRYTCRETKSIISFAETGDFTTCALVALWVVVVVIVILRVYPFNNSSSSCRFIANTQEEMCFMPKLRVLLSIVLLLFISGTLRVSFHDFFLQYTMLAKNSQHTWIPLLSMGMVLHGFAKKSILKSFISCAASLQ